MSTVEVARPGLLSTVQDLGRWGWQSSGVPVSGPMDARAHRLANLLVGNAPDAATIEITLVGPELIFDDERTVAVCGADFVVTVGSHLAASGVPFRVPLGGHLRFAQGQLVVNRNGRRLCGRKRRIRGFRGKNHENGQKKNGNQCPHRVSVPTWVIIYATLGGPTRSFRITG